MSDCYACQTEGCREHYHDGPGGRNQFSFLRQPDDPGGIETLYLGFELEAEFIDGEYDDDALCSVNDIVNDNMLFSSDGSLHHGMELKHFPATFEWYNANKNSIATVLQDANEISHTERTCGMHVHMSRKPFSTQQIVDIIKMFINNRNKIILFSRRHESDLNEWAPINDNALHDFESHGQTYKYNATSVNSKTIEIRLFDGTLDVDEVYANLEFCYGLYNYTKDAGDLHENEYLEWEHFASYVTSHPETYPNLINKLQEVNLCSI